jgi:hypothetical protein
MRTWIRVGGSGVLIRRRFARQRAPSDDPRLNKRPRNHVRWASRRVSQQGEPIDQCGIGTQFDEVEGSRVVLWGLCDHWEFLAQELRNSFEARRGELVPWPPCGSRPSTTARRRGQDAWMMGPHISRSSVPRPMQPDSAHINRRLAFEIGRSRPLC